MTLAADRLRVRCAYVDSHKRRCSNSVAEGSRFCRTHPWCPTLAEWRQIVAERLERALAAEPGVDPIADRLDEYRACIAELDALIAKGVEL